MKYCFLFNSWFASKRSDEATMDVGADIIVKVSTNTKKKLKDHISNLKKDWPEGSYLLLKRNYMVPRYRPLISVGYNYNYRKVPSFIAVEDSGSIKYGITYLSKYPYHFSYVAI